MKTLLGPIHHKNRASNSAVIVVHGVPGAGKTTLAQKLSAELGVPALSKDRIKVSLAETIPGAGLEWSRTLGGASIRLVKELVRDLVAGSSAFIIDNAFLPDHDDDFFEELSSKGVELIQVYCKVPLEVAKERFEQRVRTGERHSCHQDQLRLASIDDWFSEEAFRPLKIARTIVYDSTRENAVRDCIRSVQKFLANFSK